METKFSQIGVKLLCMLPDRFSGLAFGDKGSFEGFF
jgi:hypothetical protein